MTQNMKEKGKKGIGKLEKMLAAALIVNLLAAIFIVIFIVNLIKHLIKIMH